MSSGFTVGDPRLCTVGRRSTSTNPTYSANHSPHEQPFPLRSPIFEIPIGPTAQTRQPDLFGKRSLHEFQRHGLGFYHRNVKQRPNYQHASSSPVTPLSSIDSPPISSVSSEVSSNSVISIPNRNSMNFTRHECERKRMMNDRLEELERALLGDDEDTGEVSVSCVTNSEWSDTIHNLIDPTRNPISPSPTSSSSSSSCCSTVASPPISCAKQSLIDAAAAIADGNSAVAAEILTRLQQFANQRGTAEQRLIYYIISALISRVNLTNHPYSHELHSKEHISSTQMLRDVSPCFKLGLMAANLAILKAAKTSEQGSRKIHIVDFDLGQGGQQYMHLLHALAANYNNNSAAVRITAVVDYFSGDEEKLRIVGKGLKSVADKLSVSFKFSAVKLDIVDLNRENLGIEPDEFVAVNLAFKLHKLPDESVTTENPRDALLRGVKGLASNITTTVEQEMNANTATLAVRVREIWEHYGSLFDAVEVMESPDRVRVEEGMGRVMRNMVACEGRDRVERCELFGKWRARMSMAGFQQVEMGRPVSEMVRVVLNSGTRGNPGFTVDEQAGGICFGWMGRTLTVASAWR